MNKEPSVLLLEHHLKALKLPTFLRDYASVGAVCGQERADYECVRVGVRRVSEQWTSYSRAVTVF